MSKLILGVDESGLGSWAGPYTVAAAALTPEAAAWLSSQGLKDSKRMSRAQRAIMFELVEEKAVAIDVEIVEVATIDRHRGTNVAWATAVNAVIKRIQQECDPTEIVVDGRAQPGVTRAARFLPQADDLVPAVSAASIIAKTIRDTLMCDLHAAHPVYDWDVNAGYHAPKHVKGIREHGICVHHRNITPLRGLINAQRRST